MLPEWRSPLTPGVQLANLSHSPDLQTLRADLGNDWPRMLRQLSGVGPGLMMTRNEAVILGRRTAYPHLEFTVGESKGADAHGGLWVDFRMLGGAHAVHTRREPGHVFGVEFKDAAGCMVHRFTLTAESELDEFCGWVRLHQACEAHVPQWISEARPGPDANPEATPAGAVEYAGGHDILEGLLGACVERKVALRVTVHSGAVIQRASFIPESLRPTEGWWFASSNEVGLHFRSELFNGFAVEDMAGGRSALRCSTREHACALRLEPEDAGCGGAWSKLLAAMF